MPDERGRSGADRLRPFALDLCSSVRTHGKLDRTKACQILAQFPGKKNRQAWNTCLRQKLSPDGLRHAGDEFELAALVFERDAVALHCGGEAALRAERQPL